MSFAALTLLGVVLAYWTWAWLAPRPEPRAQAAVQPDSRTEAAYGLFRSAQQGGAGPARIAVGLLGVVAAQDSASGYAVLRLDAKETVAVREGGEIEPGVRLAEVHANYVVLERGGVREKLDWPEVAKSTVPAAPRTGK